MFDFIKKSKKLEPIKQNYEDYIFYTSLDAKSEQDLLNIIARVTYDTGINNITIIKKYRDCYSDLCLGDLNTTHSRGVSYINSYNYSLATKTKEEFDIVTGVYGKSGLGILNISPYVGITYKSYVKVPHLDGFVQYIPVPSSYSSTNNKEENRMIGDLYIREGTKRVCLFYHDDHDGIFAARVVYEYLVKSKIVAANILSFGGCDIINKYIDIDMIPIKDYSIDLRKEYMKYHGYKENDTIKYSETLFIFVDYSFTNKYNLQWFGNLCINTDVILIDHHVNSCKTFDLRNKSYEYPNLHGYLDTKYCGAVNAYKYLYGDKEIPKILQYVDSYDTWKHNMPETTEFHYGLLVGSPKDEFFLNKDWMTDESIIDKSIENGKLFLKFYDFENKTIHLDYSFQFKIRYKSKEYSCIAINRRGPSRMFLDNIEKYDILCPWYFNGEMFIYSLYSDKSKNAPCGEIATALGGGGHPNAAGFQSTNLIIYKGFVLNVKDGDN